MPHTHLDHDHDDSSTSISIISHACDDAAMALALIIGFYMAFLTALIW
jgi:hypothetical protein